MAFIYQLDYLNNLKTAISNMLPILASMTVTRVGSITIEPEQ
jgi:hypothetical protein